MEKEAIERKIKTLDEKISMRHIIDNLKLKRFKKIELTVRLATLAFTSGIAGAAINNYMNIDDNKSSIYSEIETSSLSNADDEVIVDYISSSYLDLSDYISEDMNANELLEAVNTSYYSPALQTYTDYKETNDEKYHDDFIKLAKDYEDRVVSYNPNLSFDNSIYKYAKYIDGSVCVPYSNVIDDSTLPEGYKVDNNVVYVPLDNSKDDIKALGND